MTFSATGLGRRTCVNVTYDDEQSDDQKATSNNEKDESEKDGSVGWFLRRRHKEGLGCEEEMGMTGKEGMKPSDEKQQRHGQ